MAAEKISDLMLKLRSSNVETVMQCLKQLKDLSNFSAQELIDTGIYAHVDGLRTRKAPIGYAARRVIDRWRVLVSAYEQSDSGEDKPDSMDPGSSGASQKSSKSLPDFQHGHHNNHFKRDFLLDDDVPKNFSDESEEPTYHHGLEPERKNESRIDDMQSSDPLHLGSMRSSEGSSKGSSEGFRSKASSDRSSNHSQASWYKSPKVTEGKPEKRYAQMNGVCHQKMELDFTAAKWNPSGKRNVELNGTYQPNANSGSLDDKRTFTLPNGMLSSDNSPQDLNLLIEAAESSSNQKPLCSTGLVGERAIFDSLETGLSQCRARKVDNGYNISPFKLHAYCAAQQGYTAYKYFMEKALGKRARSAPPGYFRKGFQFHTTAFLKEQQMWPSFPADSSPLNPDRDFRLKTHSGGQNKVPSHNGKSLPLIKTATDEHSVKKSTFSHSKSSKVPILPKSSSGSSDKHAASGPADASSFKERPISSTSKKSDNVSSHKESSRHSVEKKTSDSLKRKAEKGSRADLPTDFLERPKKISRTSSPLPDPNSGQKSRSEGKANRVVEILRSIPALKDTSELDSSVKPPITMMDVAANINFAIVSPIGSPKRGPAQTSHPKSKEKNTKVSVKAGASPILDVVGYNHKVSPTMELARPSTSRVSPFGELNRHGTATKNSPSLEQSRFGASKGSPNIDSRARHPSGNSGPGTSKGASKESSKEKKQSKPPKKKQEGKLFLQSKKDFQRTFLQKRK